MNKARTWFVVLAALAIVAAACGDDETPSGETGGAIEPAKTYKVAGWAPVAEGAKGEPIWDVVATYLRSQKVVKPVKLNQPAIKGVAGNPGIS